MKFLQNKISVATKKKLSLFILALTFSFINAQTTHLEWETSVEKKSDTEYTLILKANLEEK